MTAEPRISVCIPAYNHAKYVRAAIESVLSQQVDGIEVVITDDASTDGTAEAILAIGDPRISFYRNEANLGPSVTANRNVARARGDFICFLPSDDVFLPGKIARQLEAFEREPGLGGVFTWMQMLGENGEPTPESTAYFRPRGVTRTTALRHFFYEGNLLSAPTAMLRRDVFTQIGSFDPCLWQTQDYDLWVRLCVAYPIHMLEEELVGYRMRSGGANMHVSSPATDARIAWEFPRVLRRFLALRDRDLLLSAFPEAEALLDKGVPQIAALPLLGLDAVSAAPQAFGIEALYQALNDPATAAALQAAGYGYSYFYQKLGQVDPMRAATVRDAGASARLTGLLDLYGQLQIAYTALSSDYDGLAASHADVAEHAQRLSEAKEWWQSQAENWEKIAHQRDQ